MKTVSKEIYRTALTPDSEEVIFKAENWFKNMPYDTEISCMTEVMVKIRTKSISKAALDIIAGERDWRISQIRTGDLEIQIFTNIS